MGFSSTALTLHSTQLKQSIEKHNNNESYTLLAQRSIGGIALLVLSRDSTVTDKVVDIRVAECGTGIAHLMGNKGAVGVRVVLDGCEDDEGEGTGDVVFTFGKPLRSSLFDCWLTKNVVATAHLAAHDKYLERRNQDWKSIVQRLVFTSDSSSRQFKPKSNVDIFKQSRKAKKDGIQLYDSSYLFFFGVSEYQSDLCFATYLARARI